MRIKQLKIAGFRGFNEERIIDFHEHLTVMSGPNSYGKTSISEAMEFLLYVTTSKVDWADSKEEYKDSYRNRHFPADQKAYIEVDFVVEDDHSQRLRVELDAAGVVQRFIDGKTVGQWPFQSELLVAARPFVLQHTLKYLLLVTPADRFQGFAKLLGLNEIDNVFRAILSLCTKPTANVSEEGNRILSDLASLEAKLTTFPDLKGVVAAFKKGSAGVENAYTLIEGQADKLSGDKVTDGDRLDRLTAARAAASAKVYQGHVALRILTPIESGQLSSTRKTLSAVVDAKLLEDYGRLCVQGVAANLRKEAKLLDFGADLLEKNPDICPLCKQSLDARVRQSLHERHMAVIAEIQKDTIREQGRSRVTKALENAKETLKQHKDICVQPLADVIASMQPENEQKVIELLGGPTVESVGIIRAAASTANILRGQLQDAAAKVEVAVAACEAALEKDVITLAQANDLGIALHTYLTTVDDVADKIKRLGPGLAEPAKIFRQAIDALAGTAEISLVIELLEKRHTIEQGLQIRDVLEGLKDFKKLAEQTLAEIMQDAMNTELTAAVMKWYEQIKTVGDPNVHFSGFAMDRTKSGDFKSRRLTVKAQSYGVDLVSAVSSLSESKLNALGLCVSIASAIRRPGPWSFLIIDDPIQSWDDEHEMQFVNVIRNLVEQEGKQVVVLSHKMSWVKQVCDGCRTLNGMRYEITSYTKEGPKIAPLPWSPLEERIHEAEAIVNDPAATSVRLQHADEDIRLIACELASMAAKIILNRDTSPHNMNKGDVRSILVAAGVSLNAVDRIQAMFVTADDSHHSPKNYQPNVHRIRQALSSIREVLKEVKSRG